MASETVNDTTADCVKASIPTGSTPAADASEHVSTVRVIQARLPHDLSIIVHAHEIAEKRDLWPKTLACATPNCQARVHPVNATRTETSNGRTPHFARNPSGHEPNTTANFASSTSTGRSASSKRPVETSSKRPAPEDTEREDRVTIWRLPWPRTFNRDPAPTSTLTGDEPMVVARELLPLLNTAAKIAALLQQFHEAGADPMVEFQARCDGQDVDWMNFFYTRHRAFVLAARIRAAQTRLDALPPDRRPVTRTSAAGIRSPLGRPAAVVFRVDRLSEPDNNGRGWAMSILPTPPKDMNPKANGCSSAVNTTTWSSWPPNPDTRHQRCTSATECGTSPKQQLAPGGSISNCPAVTVSRRSRSESTETRYKPRNPMQAANTGGLWPADRATGVEGIDVLSGASKPGQAAGESWLTGAMSAVRR